MTPKSYAETLIEAARQVVLETPGERAATARRIHESMARKRKVHKRRINIVAAIMATLFGSTAFAWYAGWRPPWSPVAAPIAAPAPAEQHVRAPAPKRASAPVPIGVPPVAPLPDPATAPAPEAIAVPGAPSLPEVAPETPAPAPVAVPTRPAPAAIPEPTRPTPAPARVTRRVPVTVVPPRAVPAPPPAPTEVATAPTPAVGAPLTTPVAPTASVQMPSPERLETVGSEELAYYRRAHDAHFRGTNAIATLAAWDDYLARFPNGQLSLEARYDRALILIKLQRWSAAEQALRPFATAPAGAYRQAEATRLLDAVRQR